MNETVLSRESQLKLKHELRSNWQNLLLKQSAMTVGAVALMIFFFSSAGVAVIGILGALLCIMPVRTLIQLVKFNREIAALEARS